MAWHMYLQINFYNPPFLPLLWKLITVHTDTHTNHQRGVFKDQPILSLLSGGRLLQSARFISGPILNLGIHTNKQKQKNLTILIATSCPVLLDLAR